jgi:hypothetical protein
LRIDEQYIIERQGRRMALYAGLLDAAHSLGLRSIETHLVQIPEADNGDVAIVTAEVVLQQGGKFEGIGDASPENVARNIRPHLIRMAETRAKARALRDAVNVGDALSDDPLPDEAPAHTQADVSYPAPPPEPEEGPSDAQYRREGNRKPALPQDGDPIMPAQKTVLDRLLWQRAQGRGEDDYAGTIANFEKYVGKKIDQLTYGDANWWIEWLAEGHKETTGEE